MQGRRGELVTGAASPNLYPTTTTWSKSSVDQDDILDPQGRREAEAALLSQPTLASSHPLHVSTHHHRPTFSDMDDHRDPPLSDVSGTFQLVRPPSSVNDSMVGGRPRKKTRRSANKPERRPERLQRHLDRDMTVRLKRTGRHGS